VGGDNTITFNLVSPTYSAEIATTGTIKIKATSTTNTKGTVAVAGGLTLTKTGGTAITLTCTGVQIVKEMFIIDKLDLLVIIKNYKNF
jgi:hypothetical protein